MTLTLDLPEDVATILRSDGRNIEQVALEALAVEEYRARRLSDAHFRRLLGLSRMEADRVRKNHCVWLDYTLEDFEREGRTTCSDEAAREK